MNEASTLVYRVVHWGTGNVGYHSLRATLQNPQLKLTSNMIETLLDMVAASA